MLTMMTMMTDNKQIAHPLLRVRVQHKNVSFLNIMQ
jgi:hypothetical protein